MNSQNKKGDQLNYASPLPPLNQSTIKNHIEINSWLSRNCLHSNIVLCTGMGLEKVTSWTRTCKTNLLEIFEQQVVKRATLIDLKENSLQHRAAQMVF